MPVFDSATNAVPFEVNIAPVVYVVLFAPPWANGNTPEVICDADI